MANYIQVRAFVVGHVGDVYKLHRRILRAEMERPANHFSHNTLRTDRRGIAAAAYHCAQSQMHPHLEAVLGDEDPWIDSLDVCVYLGVAKEDEVEWDTLCYHRGTLISSNAEAGFALGCFRQRCEQYWLDLSRCVRLDALLQEQLSVEVRRDEVSTGPSRSPGAGSPVEHNATTDPELNEGLQP